ncbi:hypothetical protein A359_07400 [secondary endosymbiont of Ctenarytaina eucalypti]|uniref:Uncharacterized protein n=1 Tax=secondary endosymbiont of Ctenarytaina eucalypti TaxID=1199245 RepID=J3VT19_9ENTR|nr:hypothetical protein A359_07400 [secondary endosymbiont of Ctenarytaina eucalypti]
MVVFVSPVVLCLLDRKIAFLARQISIMTYCILDIMRLSHRVFVNFVVICIAYKLDNILQLSSLALEN